jgi:UDP:flavonoid glycosyltransferase YjiC (YdhE family)
MHIVPYVPHRRVMPLATVCVTHGGHATLAEALAHGVPMVLLPNPMSDQLYLANRVATSGAAVVVDQDAIGAEIREAVVKVLSDKTYVRAAAALSGRCNADSAARAADAVEAAAIERAPVR